MPRRPSQLQQIVETDVAELRRRLKVGEIVPARVSRVLGDGHYAITVRNETVHAQSHLALDKGVLYAVVESLRPRIRLRLVPLQNDASAEAMIRLAIDHGLPLDPATQLVLSRLLANNTLPDDLPAFVDNCRRLSDLLPRGSRIPYLTLLDLVTGEQGEGVPALDTLLDLLDASDTLLPELFTPPVAPEDALAFAWLMLRLEGRNDNFRHVFATPRLERWRALLGALNARLADVSLQVWLLPVGDRLRVALVERFVSGGVSYHRLWARTGVFGEVRLELQQADGGALAEVGLDNSLAIREFERCSEAFQDAVRPHLPDCRLRIELDRPGDV